MGVIKIGCRFSAKIYTTCQRTMPPLVHVNYNLQQLLIMSNSLQWMAIDGMFWGKINSILCIPSPFNCGNLNMSLGLSQHHLVLCNDFLWTCSHHKWPWICSVCRNPSQSYPYSWFITKFVTQLVPQMEKELLTLPKHLSSTLDLSWVHVIQSLVFSV
jgi:hypothetical protein